MPRFPRRPRIRPDAIRKPEPRRPRPAVGPVGYYEGTQRPLPCLAFLLPIVVAYELGLMLRHGGNLPHSPDLAAQLLLHWFFSLFGATGYFLPGFALVAVLLGWHLASRQPWKVEPVMLAGMAAESVLLALPLLTLNRLVDSSSLAAGLPRSHGVWDELLLSIGAGIYEELVFRLMLITLLMLLLKDVGGMRQTPAVAFTLVISSLAFAAHHYQPIGNETFAARDFAFRTLAGGYLAGVYVTRGFGIAVGAHALYDIIVVALM